MKMLRNQISWICNEHDYLSDSDKVNENDKKIFLKLQDISEENLSEDLIKISVATIIRMMNAHYGKPVILLLDEYDVPLAKASSNGYYKEMLDVMNYVRDLRINPDMKPASYWKNTSDNAIIQSFIDYAGSGIQKKMEKLMAGDTIDQKIEENLTYDYLHSSEENFWSILYLTGYLTRDKEEKESADRKHLFDAVWNGDEQALTQEISRLLRITISYHDYREDFYHAFLAGIFAGAGYSVESNKEHGEGRSDIVIFNEYEGKVAVFEAKYSKEVKKLEEDCEKAIQQIDHRMYAKEFEDSYDEVICYGISFYKKRCVVKRDVK